MLPQEQINPMGLSPQRSASMMGNVSSAAMMPEEASAPAVDPTQLAMQEVAGKFQGAWKQLEDLNGKFGGDSDKFRTMQKAMENWFSDIAARVPESSQTTY